MTQILQKDNKALLHNREGRTKFDSIREIVEKARGKQHFLAMDYKCFYYELKLADDLEDRFIAKFHKDKNLYTMKKLAMGISPAVAVAQKTSQSISSDALQVTIQIENTYVWSPPQHLTLRDTESVRQSTNHHQRGRNKGTRRH